jgi:hypothetical protein
MGDFRTDRGHDPRAFMTGDKGGHGLGWPIALGRVEVGMADPVRDHFDQNLAGPWCRDRHLLDCQRLAECVDHRRLHRLRHGRVSFSKRSENMMGTVRRVCRNVKRWRNAAMALRTAAGMMEAAKGFRRLKSYKHLPVLRTALAAHQSKYVTQRVEHDADAAKHDPRRCLLRLLQQNLGHPGSLSRDFIVSLYRRRLRAAERGMAQFGPPSR